MPYKDDSFMSIVTHLTKRHRDRAKKRYVTADLEYRLDA